jgi:hypothetical protein
MATAKSTRPSTLKAVPKKRPTNPYEPGTTEYNSRVIGEFTANRGPAKGREKREITAYSRYRDAVARGRLPHSGEIMGTIDFFAKSNDNMVKALARQLKRRRTMLLFQDTLDNVDGEARGHLFVQGDLRNVDIDGKETKGIFNSVIKIRSELADSPLAAAGTAAHELGHILWREARAKGRPIPKAIKDAGGDYVLETEEDWCDYLEGKALASFGYNGDAITSGAKHLEWGKNWREFDGVLRRKYNLYKHMKAAVKQETPDETPEPDDGNDGWNDKGDDFVFVSGYVRNGDVVVNSYVRRRPHGH